jgi:hypothetical protein
MQGGDVRVEVAWVDDTEGGLAELEEYLRDDPRLDGVLLQRGRPVVPPESLGAAEVLEAIGTNVGLGLVANALYDFLKQRVARGPAARLRVTRTDLPDGARQVDLDADGSEEHLRRLFRDLLDD